jgi:DNA-binding response OmpR family regulator
MEKIMVIDADVQELRKLNSDLSKDFVVLTCSRVNKALDLLQVFQPSALILDPSISGFNVKDFVQQIRSTPQLEGIFIIALTRITSFKYIEESFDWGVDLIYSKPCSSERIRKKTAEYLLRKRTSRILEPA